MANATRAFPNLNTSDLAVFAENEQGEEHLQHGMLSGGWEILWDYCHPVLTIYLSDTAYRAGCIVGRCIRPVVDLAVPRSCSFLETHGSAFTFSVSLTRECWSMLA